MQRRTEASRSAAADKDKPSAGEEAEPRRGEEPEERGDSKETRLTLMEEVLLLGLKDREVSLTPGLYRFISLYIGLYRFISLYICLYRVISLYIGLYRVIRQRTGCCLSSLTSALQSISLSIYNICIGYI